MSKPCKCPPPRCEPIHCDPRQHYDPLYGWRAYGDPPILCPCADAELREARAVLSALGAVKGPEGWTVGCDEWHMLYLRAGDETPALMKCGALPFRVPCTRCNGTGRIPVPIAALTDKEEPR